MLHEALHQEHQSYSHHAHPVSLSGPLPLPSYNFDLKELIPENTAFTADKKEESKKAIRKQFETVYVAPPRRSMLRSYLNQANIKSEKSKQGCAYFFKKLRF